MGSMKTISHLGSEEAGALRHHRHGICRYGITNYRYGIAQQIRYRVCFHALFTHRFGYNWLSILHWSAQLRNFKKCTWRLPVFSPFGMMTTVCMVLHKKSCKISNSCTTEFLAIRKKAYFFDQIKIRRRTTHALVVRRIAGVCVAWYVSHG